VCTERPKGPVAKPHGWGQFMIKRSSQALGAWFVFWDLVLTATAWIGAYYIRFLSGWIPIYKTPIEVTHCWRNLPLVLLLSLAAYHLTGQYTIHRLRRFREEMVGAMEGTILLSLLVMATTFYRQDHYDSRATMLLFSTLCPAGILTSRRVSWFAIRYFRSRG